MIEAIVLPSLMKVHLDTAVGRSGVNINLAAKLTGYTIDAYTEKEYEEIFTLSKNWHRHFKWN